MSATAHSIRHYFRRFRIELVLFWIVSGALGVVLFSEGSGEVISRLKSAEILMLLVVVMRLTMAESVLKTTNGWHMRPVAKQDLTRARGILLLVAIVPALFFRGWVWFVKANPDWGNAFDLAWNDLLPLGIFIVVIVGVMRLAMKLKARESGGLWLLLVAPLLVMLVAFWVSRTSFLGSQWSSVPDARPLPRSVTEVMREGDRPIGKPPLFNGSELEVLGRFPMVESRRRLHGFGCRLEQVRLEENELRFLVKLESADPLPRPDDLLFVARFPDGSYSGPLHVDGGSFRTRVPLFERYGREMKMRFPTPLALPWNRMDAGRILDGTELWVLGVTGEPYFPRSGPADLDGVKLGLAALEIGHADPLSSQWKKQWKLIRPEDLLQWPTWSHSVWLNLVNPVLKEHDISHLEKPLLERLKNDVRPAQVMADNGMEEGVMDELAKRLDEGLPLDANALIVMMEEGEFPADRRAVRALVQVPDWNDGLQKMGVGYQPEAFPELAENAWVSSGAAAGDTPARLGLASMAAQRGDARALRFLAREGDVRRVKRLIDASVDDPIVWLARHLVAFDPERRIFREASK